MAGPFEYGVVNPAPVSEVEARQVVHDAGVRYLTGVNQAFVEAGCADDAQMHLCGACTPAQAPYCGAVVAGLRAVLAEGGIARRRDRETLEVEGIDVSNGGYTLCPDRLITGIIGRLADGSMPIGGADPLRGAGIGHQAVDTVRLTTKNLVAKIQAGVRK